MKLNGLLQLVDEPQIRLVDSGHSTLFSVIRSPEKATVRQRLRDLRDGSDHGFWNRIVVTAEERLGRPWGPDGPFWEGGAAEAAR